MAPSNVGFISITNLKGAEVRFGLATHGSKLDAKYVKLVKQEGYNLSVVEVGYPITTNMEEVLIPSPTNMNTKVILMKGGARSSPTRSPP